VSRWTTQRVRVVVSRSSWCRHLFPRRGLADEWSGADVPFPDENEGALRAEGVTAEQVDDGGDFVADALVNRATG
jgi:hypothetical protein